MHFYQEELLASDAIDLRPIDGNETQNVVQSGKEDIGSEALDFAGRARRFLHVPPVRRTAIAENAARLI